MNKSMQLGDKIELVTEVTLDGTQEVYYSKVQELVDDNTIVILAPISNNRIEPLELSGKYGLSVYTNQGLYRCEVMVSHRVKDDNLYLITLVRQTALQKYQRRQYYRMDCMLTFQYKGDAQDQWYEGTIVDISGGGIRFTSKYGLDVTKELINHITLHLKGNMEEELYLSGIIVNSEKTELDSTMYENRVKFDGIDTYERETIIKFIFEEERLRRSRGKG